MEAVQHGWSLSVPSTDKAKIITAKFKNLRRVLKAWQAHLSSLKANIHNIKLVLAFLEILEEFRDLSLFEWNFKTVLCDKLTSLLEQQRIYWKQRGTIKWVKFGDEGTKFFHANATIKFNRNLITTLKDPNGSLVSNHEQKATILWEAFKERLGKTEFQQMLFDLQVLINPATNLHDLDIPFSTEEIDEVVK